MFSNVGKGVLLMEKGTCRLLLEMIGYL